MPRPYSAASRAAVQMQGFHHPTCAMSGHSWCRTGRLRLVIEHGHGHEDDHAPAWRFSVVLWANRAAGKCSNHTARHRLYMTDKGL